MEYQLVIDGATVYSGTVFFAVLAIVLILILFAVITSIIWRELRANETMKYEFVTIIAHKFRTPLTTVKWLLENLIKDETDPQKKESFSDIKTSNEKLINLTSTLIELTNEDNETKSAYTFEKVSFCEFVKSIADAHKDMFHEKNIFFAVQCAEPDLLVIVDRARMEFVLQVLFENACNYTAPGRNVDVLISRKGRKALLTITDHGIGIEDKDMPKIFTKFFRAENAREMDTEGFGVGLFLAQSIMKRHRGHIYASSAGKDKGSTFTLVLPRS